MESSMEFLKEAMTDMLRNHYNFYMVTGVKGVWEGLEPCRRHRLNMILDEEGGRENDRRKKNQTLDII